MSDYGNSRVLRFTTLSNGAAATAAIGQASFTSTECNRGGVPSANSLCSPFGMTLDRDGNLLVADYLNGRALRYDLPRARAVPAIATISPESIPQGGGTFTLTVNGSRFHGNSVVNFNGAPLATQFLSDRRLVAQVPAASIASSGPFAVTVATPGPGGGTSSLLNLQTYVRAPLDGVADLILSQPNFTAAVSHNPQVGEESLGTVNAATQGTFSGAHVAIDPASGRLFVAEIETNRVRSWANVAALHNGQPADLILGQPDEFSSSCNTGALSAATLCQPFGLAVDASGALYVSDRSNNRVLRYAPPFSTGMAATRVYGQGGSYTSGIANNGGVSANSLNFPHGVAVSASALFVYDSSNSRVLVYNNPTADFTADVVIGQSSMTSGAGAAASSTNVGNGEGAFAIDGEGRLFVASQSQNRILRFTPPFTNAMAADLVIGQPDFGSTVPATTASGLKTPIGIAFDPAGNLFVAEFGNHRVLRYAAPLESAMAATGVLGQTNFTTATSGTSSTKFTTPIGLAFDAVGNLFVSEFQTPRVLGFDRPFAFVLDPAKDLDRDGIPNARGDRRGPQPVREGQRHLRGRRARRAALRDAAVPRLPQPRGRSRRASAGWTDFVPAGTYSRPQVIDALPALRRVRRLRGAGGAAVLRDLPARAGLRRAHLQRGAGARRHDHGRAAGRLLHGEPGVRGDLRRARQHAVRDAALQQRAGPRAGSGRARGLGGRCSRRPTRAARCCWASRTPSEYQAAMANEVFVTMMYAGMLRRTPEPAGFNGWVAFLDAGTYTREQVINGFFLSAEYRARFLP